jgi:2-polyprenyl-3-methyl-5-hydroxy-6-metoxy-1,4-benzoquinol methylase
MTRLEVLVAAVVAIWPKHEGFLRRSLKSLTPETAAHADFMADLVLRIAAGEVEKQVAGYRWLCDMILEEELEFRRCGSYRYATQAEVNERLYQDAGLMALYLDGLLLSQALWSNHITTSHFLVADFLPRLRRDGRCLEIGPGHGLLLTLLAGQVDEGAIEGWDISPTSVAQTEQCLARLGVQGRVSLHVRNLFACGDGPRFDAIVLSEILEHLENPKEALRHAGRLLDDGGLLFVNVPTNAPTLDHIHLFRTPDEAEALLNDAGFDVVARCLAPSSGYRLEKALHHEATISCAFVARASVD